MQDPVNFCARCPVCKNEAAQGPLERSEIGMLLKASHLSFHCDLCALEWVPSSRELANVELLLTDTSWNPAEDQFRQDFASHNRERV
jgi:hypothetical protein